MRASEVSGADAAQPFGGLAVVGPSWRLAGVRRRGGGEDPWLCGPGFRRVCLCRWFGMGEPTIKQGRDYRGLPSGMTTPPRHYVSLEILAVGEYHVTASWTATGSEMCRIMAKLAQKFAQSGRRGGLHACPPRQEA